MAMRAMQNKPPEPYFPVLRRGLSRIVEGQAHAGDVIAKLIWGPQGPWIAHNLCAAAAVVEKPWGSVSK